MENDVDCARLARQTQPKNSESLAQSAKPAVKSLRENTYRMMFERDPAQGIV
jgi:hypothetical protein